MVKGVCVCVRARVRACACVRFLLGRGAPARSTRVKCECAMRCVAESSCETANRRACADMGSGVCMGPGVRACDTVMQIAVCAREDRWFIAVAA